MSMTSFFQKVPTITLHDGLAQLLGASDDGLITYDYEDAVKLAGHSCPTVAGAWLSTIAGIEALFPNQIPERGAIAVALPDAEDAGVTGVIGQIVTLITGAAGVNGFHGLGGQHRRAGLLSYNDNAVNGIRFTRTDNGDTVEVQYDPRSIPMSADMQPLMGAIINGVATDTQTRQFGTLWQARVKRILLDDADKLVRVRKIAA